MHERKDFWDKNAGRYDRFMRNDRVAYEKMYGLIRPVVKAKTVLEVAAGTGLIAKSIVDAAAHIEATDASAKMVLEAKRGNQSAKLHFSVQDMFRLPHALLRQNGWAVQKSAVLKASFPLTYAECTKSEGPDVVL